MLVHAPFLKDPITKQVWEWTEKLQKVALQRGLVPYDPEAEGKPVQRRDVTKMNKVQCITEAHKYNVKLDIRQSRADLRKAVLEIQDND